VKKGMGKMFKMNKNRINRKKSGIHSPALMLLTVLMVLGYIFMIIIFARMAVINREEIRKEAEAGNELIRIYIYIDEENVVSTATTNLYYNIWNTNSNNYNNYSYFK
jgi:flagellar basal body-associated protein FliL